ncbi:NAD(P)/FAD-dependent oxidoreductase [Paramaledivibacter caminithermalis]|jgi:sarcosine oxidase subunit beta|uniref:Sarcosine oxidase subunit beta n=1 Tax=Paramaledivibacter caminithermalis (strain DSM 15212 / CIP 107654 / DViRD3) TaxID=1121301 RepID=A0A1M6PST5_PARC5|nr:FAD-binding oxidoreductase [Paramaledivibacter caminithermalis]SHK10956.1 sarcosine oxidase subunit beta [Paramaledivibacter caminithermalis DSM 15212]
MIKSADVVIIGGGISGVAIAYNLAKKGVRNVAVIEKGYLASGSTGRCGAGIRQQWGTEMNCRIAKFACELFENANEELEYEGDIEFKQGGYLMISSTEKEHEQFKKNVELQNSLGIPSRLLSLEEAKEIVPFLNTDGLVSATFCQKDGHLNPFHTTDAFARAAERLGVKIYKFTEVTSIITENNRIKGVRTTKGDISTNVIVNAAGGYSQQIGKMVGIDLPIYSERHQILVTEAIDQVLEPMVMSFSLNLYCQQVPHGGLLMGRGDEGEPRDLRITSGWHFLEEMTKTITNVLPPLKNARMIRQWAGLYNITPDRQPILGPVDEVEGFYLAVGFSGHGFMFGPATGVLIAECILGEDTTLPIDMLHLNRFKKGELIFEPSVV